METRAEGGWRQAHVAGRGSGIGSASQGVGPSHGMLDIEGQAAGTVDNVD
jgi:hypothetical protein